MDSAGRVVDGEEAARYQRRHQPPHDRVRLVGVGDVVHDAQQHKRNGLGEVEGPRRLGKDLVWVTQVVWPVFLQGAGTA